MSFKPCKENSSENKQPVLSPHLNPWLIHRFDTHPIDAFLELMSFSPGDFLCPTMDIDLSWHTHQLLGTEYRIFTETHIARFVDHDDKVSEVKLGDAYDLTARAWTARYGVPYSTCGCQKQLDGLTQQPNPLKFWGKTTEKDKYDRKRQVIEQMIGSISTGEREASHPSVHSLIALPKIEGVAKQRAARDNKNHKLARANSLQLGDPLFGRIRSKMLQPDHPDPFHYTSFISQTQAGPQQVQGSGRPYWGVAGAGVAVAGAGVIVVGSAMAWGLCDGGDPNCFHESEIQRGKCAAGLGGGGSGGYCGGGGTGACECTYFLRYCTLISS